MSKQQHRKFTPEFRAEVVALCLAGDRSRAQVARDLGLGESMVSKWVQQAKSVMPGVSPVVSGGLNDAEREELTRLRKENARLRMEREILKKATVFFAAENA
jgi:transposase